MVVRAEEEESNSKQQTWAFSFSFLSFFLSIQHTFKHSQLQQQAEGLADASSGAQERDLEAATGGRRRRGRGGGDEGGEGGSVFRFFSLKNIVDELRETMANDFVCSFSFAWTRRRHAFLVSRAVDRAGKCGVNRMLESEAGIRPIA